MADRDDDPNFPIGGLSIAPSHVHYLNTTNKNDSNEWQQGQQIDIEKWGIAGRVWEAAYLLTAYLSHDSNLLFDPPCSIFNADNSRECTIMELGAGVGVAGIHLALELSKARKLLQNGDNLHDTVVLTDLENVLDLLERNVKRAKLDGQSDISVLVRALPWGSIKHADKIQQEISPRNLTHIICSDLVYFPELLCPLLRCLIYLTQSTLSTNFVEVIIGYKIRSHSKEETFWKAFGVWFDFYPVLCKKKASKDDSSEWRRFGSLSLDSGKTTLNENEEIASEDEMFVFVASRKKSTLDCQMPENDQQLLGGWLLRQDSLQQGTGAETFELLLMNAIQD